MRKGNAEAKFGTMVFNVNSLNQLRVMGYKYVQIKGLTVDKHYDYIEPHYLMLIPFKELTPKNTDNGIYEPIESDLLFQWAMEANEFTKILIAK